MVGVDWWDAVGCTQSAAEDGIGKEVLLLFFFLNFFYAHHILKIKRQFN